MYCIIVVAALIIASSLSLKSGIDIASNKFESRLEEINERVSALENERKAFAIKHNALEGCYRELVKKFDIALEYIKTLVAALRNGGVKPPDLPDGLDLDVDMQCDGNETRYQL